MASNRLSISNTKIQQAQKIFGQDAGVLIDEKNTTTVIDLKDLPKDFLRALMSTELTLQQRQRISDEIGETSSVFERRVSTVKQLSEALKALEIPGTPTVGFVVGDKRYPVPVTQVQYSADRDWGQHGGMTLTAKVCDTQAQQYVSFSERTFRDETGQPCTRTVGEILADEDIFPTSPEAIEDFRRAAARAEKICTQVGAVYDIESSVLGTNKYLWRSSLDALRLGEKGRPRQVIVEPDLEIPNGNGGWSGGRETSWTLPVVRTFSMDLKRYVYADVRDLAEHEFETGALERLVLPDELRSVLSTVFEAQTDEIFGDLFRGRHGGMVILANGPSGAGKTLTAEVFAEHTKRPLYILEMGELGTNLAAVEENLLKVFARAARWNAVLLFDEADVFLAKREETDLERSAIVGVFLRLLDRYEGMFFLTTNRGDVIDPAFQSRITLKLDYPALSGESRVKVWRQMMVAAKINFTDHDRLSEIAEENVNGRQIRNQVRLLKVMNRDKPVSIQTIRACLKYVARDTVTRS